MPFGSNSDASIVTRGSPLERVFDAAAGLSRQQAARWLALGWTLIVGIDAGTGRMVSVSGLYLVPLCFTVWCLGRLAAFIAGGAAVVITLLINGFGDGLSAQASSVPFAAAIWNAGMRVFAVVFIILAVAAFRRTFDRERENARIDPLTGLGNRRSFMIESRKLSVLALRSDRILLCGLIDLDDFKRVNDTHGHAAGDQTLSRAAEALSGMLRSYDAVARIGGDEFAFCLLVRNEKSAQTKCREIHEAVTAALAVMPWRPSCSLGASAQTSLRAAFCVADNALYVAKGEGKSTWKFQT